MRSAVRALGRCSSITDSVRRHHVAQSPRRSSAPPCGWSSSCRPASRRWSTRPGWSTRLPSRPSPSEVVSGFRTTGKVYSRALGRHWDDDETAPPVHGGLQETGGARGVAGGPNGAGESRPSTRSIRTRWAPGSGRRSRGWTRCSPAADRPAHRSTRRRSATYTRRSPVQIAAARDMAAQKGGDARSIARLRPGEFFAASDAVAFQRVRSPDVPEPPPAEPDDPGRGPGARTREDCGSRIGLRTIRSARTRTSAASCTGQNTGDTLTSAVGFALSARRASSVGGERRVTTGTRGRPQDVGGTVGRRKTVES